MCGIFCVFSNTDNNITEILSSIFQEFSLNISRRGPNQTKIEIYHVEDKILLFAASVLWCQGSQLVKQPVANKNHILAFNGDIFDEKNLHNIAAFGDTVLFLNFFSLDNYSDILFEVNGPFAFVCLDTSKSILHFGRDKFGRRSLLIGKSDDGKIVLTSVAKRKTEFKFIEVPSIGLFAFDLKNKSLILKPWYKATDTSNKLKEIVDHLKCNIIIEEAIGDSLFNNFIPPTESDLKIVNYLKNKETKDAFSSILSFPKVNEDVANLKNILERAVETRISALPKFCQNCIRDGFVCDHAIIGILFSGGVDCAILALTADKFIAENRPIDLLNVSFAEKDFSSTPDRVSGLQTLEELKKLRPNRRWNFVEINVTREELDKERSGRIADLIYPLNTILDDSLGCALWFAGRGMGENYVSPCRTLLSGAGADELFGGYSHHRAAFTTDSWLGLNNILKTDWENLPYKNLGRDDRVVSDHGRQLRTPYLDENVVHFVLEKNCWEKTLPTSDLPQEIGPKFLLRALAAKIGLEKAAILKKRALQFGSRIANSKENAHDVSPRL